MSTDRKQVNIRVDDEFLRIVGELQALIRDPLTPSLAEVIRISVANELDRRKADRKGRKT